MRAGMGDLARWKDGRDVTDHQESNRHDDHRFDPEQGIGDYVCNVL